jgi:hypothetical protein
MTTQSPADWLRSATQQRIFCCDANDKLAGLNRNEPGSSEIEAFISTLSPSSSDTSKLSDEPKAPAITAATNVIKIERILIVRYSTPESDKDLSARYFVPALQASGKYVEVHVKDVFGTNNPCDIGSGSGFGFPCKRHTLNGMWPLIGL